VRRCVVRRLVWRCLISRRVAVFVCSYWKISFSQSITDSINDLDVNVANPKHGYSGDFDLIRLFVGILPLYAINLDAMSLFAVSSFTFLAILMMLLYLMYSIDLNEWIWFCFYQKKHFTKNKKLLRSKPTLVCWCEPIHYYIFPPLPVLYICKRNGIDTWGVGLFLCWFSPYILPVLTMQRLSSARIMVYRLIFPVF